MIKIKPKRKRVSGKEKIKSLNNLDKQNQEVKAKSFDALANKALTKAEAKRIHKKTKEIENIIDKRAKQIKKTHKGI